VLLMMTATPNHAMELTPGRRDNPFFMTFFPHLATLALAPRSSSLSR
jgi:hypothetical protein